MIAGLASLAAFASAWGQSSVRVEGDEVRIDRPIPARPAGDGVLPTRELPFGSLRLESGGVRVPGDPVTRPLASPLAAPPAATPNPTAPRPAAAPTAIAPVGCSGGPTAVNQVQLGAVLDRQQANRDANRLRSRFPDLIAETPSIMTCRQQGPAGATPLYRLRLGVASADEARRVCAALTARSERCFVVRPGG
jgi:hypothetical protein